MGRARLVFLGLDSVDVDLVERWAAEGALPTLAMVFNRSLWARTAPPTGMTWATWPTLYTGVSPGRHGRYFYNQLVPGTYRTEVLRPSVMNHPPFWEALSRNGLRSAVIDAPKTDPTPDFNGVQLSDWGGHDPDFYEGPRSWPPGEAHALAARFGTDPVDINDFGGRGAADIGGFRDRMIANIARKCRLFEALLTEQDWDLFFGVFDDAHQVGHLCWHLHDPEHPRHDAALAARLGDPLKDVYRALDDALGRILAHTGRESTVIVYSSSGMGPANHGYGLLEPILRRLEHRPTWRGHIHGALKAGWDRLPHTTQLRLRGLKVRLRDDLQGPDWSTRTFFAVPMNDDGGGIRINLRDREPNGVVEPDAEYDACCAALIDELCAIVNSDTGRPLIRDVYKRTALYPGACADGLPDLLIEWNNEAPCFAAHSPRVGTLRHTHSPTRTGSHRPDGFFAVWGPALPTGSVNRRLPVADIAPTIAALLDTPLTDVDGKPIPEIVS